MHDADQHPGISVLQAAITLCDFSLPGRQGAVAGFEDWDKGQEGLIKKGYDTIRTDAYSHFVTHNQEKVRIMNEGCNTIMWESLCEVKVFR